MQSFSLSGSDDQKGLSSHRVHDSNPCTKRDVARHAALTAYRTYTHQKKIWHSSFTQKSYRVSELVCGGG